VAEPVLLMEHVRKSMRRQEVIRDFNLRAEAGQVIALLGGNGAGKSTILRMIAGILHPDAGEIRVGGLRWKDNRLEYAGRIGYMPDDYRFPGGLTAMETMAFWAKLRGLPKSRAAEALAEAGLADTGKKPVASFSKGIRQRVLFAQALIARPPLVLLDEPTNGLDPYWMESFIRLVREAAERGQTVLFSTHQLEIAEAAADRIVFLRDGATMFDIGAGRSGHGADRTETLRELFARMYGIPLRR